MTRLVLCMLLAACVAEPMPSSRELASCPSDPDAGPLPDAAPWRLHGIGDSILLGSPTYAPIARDLVASTFPGLATWDSVSGRALTESDRPTLIATALASAPDDIWIELGTNDYQHGNFTAPQFQATYALFVDELHAAMPDARIWCQTPFWKSNRGLNRLGWNLTQYRQAIQAVCNQTRPWSTWIDGLAIVPNGTYLYDGTHPNVSGNARLYDAIRLWVGW